MTSLNYFSKLKKADMQNQDVILTLVDGTTISGLPTLGADSKRIKVRTVEGVVWVPLYEIEHVTRVIQFKIIK